MTRSNSAARSRSLDAFFCGASVLVWLTATATLRLWGHHFFIPESRLSMGGMFLLALVALPLLVYGLFRWKQVALDQWHDAVFWFVIPGMLLDAMTTYFFPQLFPNMPLAAGVACGAWLLWGYAIVLIAGFWLGQSRQTSEVNA